MSYATEYVVKTRYEVDPKSAESALARVERSADAAGKSVNGLKSLLLGSVAAVAGLGIIGKMSTAFVGFNSNVEQSKIQIAGLFELNKGRAWNDNMAESSALVDRLAIRMKDAVGTTSDAVSMASMLVQPLAAAHATMGQIENTTVGAVVAAKAFGIEAGQAALDIQQALGGTLGNKDRFALAFLGPQGFSPETFNKLSASKRLEVITKALNGRAIQEMAKAQGESFAGVTSTMEDNLQQTLGKIGKPLFVAITNEVKQWNAWFEKNPEKVKQIAESVAKSLVQAFSMIKAGMEWVYQNRDLLMSLAKAALILKVGSAIGGTIGGLAGRLGEAGSSKLFKSFDELSTVTKEVAGQSVKVKSAFSGIAAAAGPLLTALAAGIGIGGMIVDGIRARRAARRAETNTYGPLAQAASEVGGGAHTEAQALNITRHAFAMGLLRAGAGGVTVDQDKLAASYGRQSEKSGLLGQLNNAAAATFGMQTGYVKTIEESTAEQRLLRLAVESLGATFRDAAMMQYAIGAIAISGRVNGIVEKAIASARPNGRNPGTVIHNLTVEVPAKDPDRWIADFNQKIDRVARVRTRARSALRGGGT